MDGCVRLEGLLKDSSRILGKGGSDFEEEVLLVAEAVGHALDDLDAVVDALKQAGVQRMAAVGEYPAQIGL